MTLGRIENHNGNFQSHPSHPFLSPIILSIRVFLSDEKKEKKEAILFPSAFRAFVSKG